jgi:signal transduction histidine kinase/AmiR/NasT family two-component response regulator
MLKRKLQQTGIAVVLTCIATSLVDYVFNILILGNADIYTPGMTLAITLTVGFPVCYFLIAQRIDLQSGKEALAKALDAAEDANRAKCAFLSNMSHEIRTPLNGVLGMAQAMDKTTLTPRQAEQLDVIRQSGETLLAIISDVLDLSEIGSGQLILHPSRFELSTVLGGLGETFAPMAAAKSINLTTMIDTGAVGAYVGDAARLRQILFNLVSNAVKFTPRGDIHIQARHDGGALIIGVSDSGVGISAERLPSLFQAFVQADSSSTRRFGGSGVGLSICRQLACAMGGSIEVASVEGHGSTFTLTLPLERMAAAAEAPFADSAEAAQAEEDGVELRVLAAEDNPTNQLVLKALLEQVGIQPHVVDNGQDALDAWAAGRWDLVLMDVQMPVMDGLDATREIRRREAEEDAAPTRIVALTANAMSHQIAEYRACGMDDVFAKPIEVMRLFQILEDAAAAKLGRAEISAKAA